LCHLRDGVPRPFKQPPLLRSLNCEFSCCAFTAVSKKVRQKANALKPEAQAEGNHVIWSPKRIPSARGSGFLDIGFTQRNIKTCASDFEALGALSATANPELQDLRFGL